MIFSRYSSIWLSIIDYQYIKLTDVKMAAVPTSANLVADFDIFILRRKFETNLSVYEVQLSIYLLHGDNVLLYSVCSLHIKLTSIPPCLQERLSNKQKTTRSKHWRTRSATKKNYTSMALSINNTIDTYEKLHRPYICSKHKIEHAQKTYAWSKGDEF